MIFYDLLLLVALLFIKKKRHHYKRLFGKIPDAQGKKTIWIHAVSLGELKSFGSLCAPLKQKYPEAFFCITCVTETALEEAKRAFPEIHSSYLPIDFSFLMRRWVKALSPQLLLFMEGDLWPNLLKEVKRANGKIALVSAKLSLRSFRRFSLVPFLAKRFFAPLDLICAQSEEHYGRFSAFVDPKKLHLTGNLKWAQRASSLEALGFPPPALPMVTIASTHKGEEELFWIRCL